MKDLEAKASGYNMNKEITVITYNMHKGMSPLNRRLHIDAMASALGHLSADVLCLQEVQGSHLKRAQKYNSTYHFSQCNYLADALSLTGRYGQNAIYDSRDHGNAILSKFEVEKSCNLNITVNKWEQRGLLHVEIHPDSWPHPLVLLCTHLNLRQYDRVKQYHLIKEHIDSLISPYSPLILAGDFNDWRAHLDLLLRDELNLQEAFQATLGKRSKSFPAKMPFLSLDRMYVRGLQVQEARVYRGLPWDCLSDHLPLSITVAPLED